MVSRPSSVQMGRRHLVGRALGELVAELFGVTASQVGQALDLMLGGGFRHLPVMEDEQLVGIVSMRDLAGSIQRR